MLREPNERLVSFWAYLNDLKGMNNTIPQTLALLLPNSMYRQLAPLNSDLSDVEATMATIKKSLADNFTVEGLTEHFDETLLMLQDAGVVKEISYKKHKVLQDSRLKFEDLSQDEQTLIKNHNKLDIELYAFAKQLFDEKVKAAGPSFSSGLAQFQETQQQQTQPDSDDVPQFGSWRCDKESRHAERRQMEERRKKHEESLPIPFQYIQALKRSMIPRYW